MADDTPTPEPTDEPTPESGPAPTPRPSPNPASRARRIGGRPTPRPASRPMPKADDADGADDAEDVATAAPAATPSPAAKAKPAPKPDATPEPTGSDDAVTPAPAPKPTAKPERKRKVAPAPIALEKPGTDDAPAPAASRSLPLRWLPAGLLALAAAVLAVFVVITSHGVYWAKANDSSGAVATRQEQVLAAAKQCFHDVTSYDYRKLSGLVEKDSACTTGTFRTQLTRSLKTQIIPNAPKLAAVQTAQVNRAGIVSVSGDGNQVVVLIYAQLSLSNNSTAKGGRVDVLGAVATMDKVRGEWLISDLDTDVGNSLSS